MAGGLGNGAFGYKTHELAEAVVTYIRLVQDQTSQNSIKDGGGACKAPS